MSKRKMYSLLIVSALTACGGSLSESSDGDSDRADGGDAASDSDRPAPIEQRDGAVFDAAGPDAESPAVLLQPCDTGARDVYFVDVQGARGTIPIGEQTCTDVGYDFVPVGPMEIDVNSASNGGGSVQILTLTDALPSPGTYSATAPLSSGPEIGVFIGDEGCGVSAGTFTIFAIEATDGDDAPSSFVVSFDLTCTLDSFGDTDALRGCLRYTAP